MVAGVGSLGPICVRGRLPDSPILHYPLARREAPTAGQRPAGEGANIDRHLVPYTRDAMRTKSRIEFIYLLIYLFIYIFVYIYASTAVLMRAHRNFDPCK